VRAVERAEAIVLALRDHAAMMEEDARAFLAEHDAGVRANALAEGAALLRRQAGLKLGRPVHNSGLRAGAILLDRAADRPAANTEPDFFQPGHTYTERDGSTDWKFRCDAITTHPEDGGRTALGWRHFRGEWSEYAYGEDDWEIHRIADSLDANEAGGAS